MWSWYKGSADTDGNAGVHYGVIQSEVRISRHTVFIYGFSESFERAWVSLRHGICASSRNWQDLDVWRLGLSDNIFLQLGYLTVVVQFIIIVFAFQGV